MSDVLAVRTRASAAAARRRRRGVARPASWTGWLLPVALLAAWQGAVSSGFLATTILPNPLGIARAGYRLTLDGQLPTNMEVSALRALVGLATGGLIGLAFGLANGLSRWSEAFTDTTPPCRWRATCRISR